MSVGDSALDYFSEKQIKDEQKIAYPSSDKFYGITLRSNDNTYEFYGFMFKKNDNNFIIYQVKGMLKMDFKECLKKKVKVKNEIKNILTKFEEVNYKSIYGKKLGKSFSEVSDFDLKDGRVRIWCENWDKNFEKSNYWNNHLSVSVVSKEYLDWLNNEAYK